MRSLRGEPIVDPEIKRLNTELCLARDTIHRSRHEAGAGV
jgi:hypothetical protein